MSAKIALALHQVMQSVGYVQKTGKNSFHGYKYAGEADLLEKLRPAMIEAGLLLIPSVQSVSSIDEHGNTIVHVEYTLAHKDGDVWPDKIGAYGCGNDKNKSGVGDKGVYKAITGANKYLLFKLFQIETGDDPENEQKQITPKDAYINLAKKVIDSFKPPAANLKIWWDGEAVSREEHGITNGTPEYKDLFQYFKDRGLDMAAHSKIEGKAA